ncbi:STAS domain-containing protein [Streptomyces hilarionis]|uniref:STAS domain-containing protein n=1 Tax=Streptomyces hilarionis TaxID=2839954 RepID=UPI00211A56AA|nr:STAS domain-containing protein [Streptomyces hilarionis]MCQ9131851.1 STAS domain-containing protein [Streptomyces hilarionis]
MTTPLTLTPDRSPQGTARLAVSGEIDMSNAGRLAEALDSGSGPLIVDLTGVEYLDSAGLSVLFAHAERLELIVPPLLGPLLSVSGLADLVTVHGLETNQPPRR